MYVIIPPTRPLDQAGLNSINNTVVVQVCMWHVCACTFAYCFIGVPLLFFNPGMVVIVRGSVAWRNIKYSLMLNLCFAQP